LIVASDLPTRINKVLQQHGIPAEQQRPLALALVREVAQWQIAQSQELVQLAEAPDLATLKIRELKELAKIKAVPNYWDMTKSQLVEALSRGKP
jgi:hypothetical protein